MANIVLRLSTGNAASTNLANQNASLGGKPAASGTGNTQITIPENSFIMNILYDNITSSENMAEVPEYRCVYIDNSATGSNQSAFLGSKIYVSGSTYAEFQLGKVAAKNTDAGVIANETAAAMLKNGRTLFAVGNRTHGKAVAFAEKYNIGKVYDSYDEMFTDPDVDIIYITTPHNTHYGFIRSIL